MMIITSDTYREPMAREPVAVLIPPAVTGIALVSRALSR
jgi:hypothetical protein